MLIEILLDVQRSDSHAHFLIGPIYALAPPVSLRLDPLEDLSEFCVLRLVFVNHMRSDSHHQAP